MDGIHFVGHVSCDDYLLLSTVSESNFFASAQLEKYSLSLSNLQEVTADTGIEIPDVSVAKQLMRQHVRNLLSNLSPRERKIIRLRFGIENGEQKSLAEIGNMFGLSKERVRQLESRALYRLKQCLGSEGLGAYTDLLV